MVIDKHKTIFVHIPKNAGTSIEDFFLNRQHEGLTEQSSKMNKKDIVNFLRSRKNKHINIYEIKKRFPNAHNSYEKFAIIRNPYDRMVSWFFFLFYPLHSYDFNEWIKDESKIQKGMDRIIGKLFVNSSDFLNPQHTWIDDTVKLIRFENINKELSSFFGKEIELPIKNQSYHNHYLEYYNQNSLDIVYERYKDDFEKFNYKKL